jgi:hypothetical protein
MIEVLSYLELSQLARNAFCRHPSLTEKERKYLAWFQEFIGGEDKDMMAFYSQKFTPELIERYFEGLERDTNIEGTLIDCFYSKEMYDDNHQLYYISFYDNAEYYCAKTNLKESCVITLFPRTLDDFINDCQRAGITLYFKVNNERN